MKSVMWMAVVTGCVAAAVPTFGPRGGVYGQEGRGTREVPVRVFGQDAGEPDPEEAKRDEPVRVEKKDPNDIKNELGDLSLFRDLKKLAKPVRKGLWEEYVNQPYYTPEVKAEKLLFCGQYEDAEAAYQELLGKKDLEAKDKAAYQEGLAAAMLNQGRTRDIKRFNELMAKLPDAMKEGPSMLRLRVQALRMAGKTGEAKTLLRGVVEKTKLGAGSAADVLALFNAYGDLLERDAEYGAAVALYDQVAKLAEEKLPETPAVQTQVLNAIWRSGVLGGSSRDRNKFVVDRLGRVCNSDSTYWPAYLLSARILLAAHNDEDGGARINDVLSRNPNNLDAMYLSLEHAIETYNFEGAERAIDELKDRSESAEVKAEEGRLLLKKRTPEKALASLKEALGQNALMPRARGWLAATYFLLNDATRGEKELVKGAGEGGTAHPVTLFEAAEVLRDARQFRQAEKMYQQAAKAASWWSEPQAALAQLYLETGQEELAKKAYEEAYRIDPTNMRAVNQLKLLEEYMKDFERVESGGFLDAEHKVPRFIIKFSPADRVLAELARDWMDKVYPEVTGYFQHTLGTPTIIEFFPNHDEFGVRTTGLPWIGTVGACTGNVIAMDVPRGAAKNMMGAFDWARVLRHEFTHTVTLSMTNNRIPHWLTEAAACEQELAPRDWDNCQLLASNYRAGMLFTLDTLTWGFIKPKRSIDRRLAYMQSQWVYQYLVEVYGQPKMLEFLRAFGAGKTEHEAFASVYGKPSEEISKDFLVWAGKQIESWGLPADKLAKKEDLDKILKEKPDDPAALYQMAWLLVSSGQRGGLQAAKENLEKAAKGDPKNTKIRELLGAVYNNLKDKAKAKEILTKVVEEDPKRAVALRTLGLLAMGEKDYIAAEKWFTALQALRPGEDTSYLRLAGIYMVKKETRKAEAQFAALQMHEQHDEVVPRQLAMLYRDDGQLAEAESSAYRAVRINPYNAVNHHLYAQILMAEGEKSTNEETRRDFARRAAVAWKYATELQPTIADFWAGLAEGLGQSGDVAGAAAAAKKAVAIQAGSPAKKWIKE